MKDGTGVHTHDHHHNHNRLYVDPVCGMSTEDEHVFTPFEYDGQRSYFCSSHCLEKFSFSQLPRVFPMPTKYYIVHHDSQNIFPTRHSHWQMLLEPLEYENLLEHIELIVSSYNPLSFRYIINRPNPPCLLAVSTTIER